MSFPQYLDIARGLVSQGKVIRRFGTNAAVSSTFSPVCRSGFYRTPLPADATQLRIQAGGNAADAAAGVGAREITIEGLDANGDLLVQTLATAGASQSQPTAASFLRVTRAYVSKSGTYATQTALSHVGTIQIEDLGGNIWATIQDTTLPRGETEIGAYTVPRFRQFYLTQLTVETDLSNKLNVVLFERRDILQSSVPFSAMRLLHEFPSLSGFHSIEISPPIVVPELTDIGFLAAVGASTAGVSVSLNGVELRA